MMRTASNGGLNPPFQTLGGSLSLEKDGLVLGTARLLPRRDGSLKVEGEEARLLTLLSVAHGRPGNVSILAALCRAQKHLASGDEAMAAMHIALIKLPQLVNPPDAVRRVAIADALLTSGVRPADIFEALDFAPTELHRLEKFNPDEPRNPRGSGRLSGEWTREIEAVESAVEDAAKELPRIVQTTSRVLPIAASAASRFAGPAAFLTALIVPTPAGGANHRGPIRGHLELEYTWNGDETELLIIRTSDGHTVLRATLGPNGEVKVGAKIVGRLRDGEVAIDPFALPPDWPNVDDSNDDRRLCPKESPDRPGRPEEKGGKKDRDFEDHMKLLVNPGDPTPRGMGYAFFNPTTGNFIIFDDCQKRSGFLFDAKGTTYDELLTSKYKPLRNGTLTDLFDTADRQIAASEGRPIYWVFAEENAANVAEQAFHEWDPRRNEVPAPKYKQIHFVFLPWREGMK